MFRGRSSLDLNEISSYEVAEGDMYCFSNTIRMLFSFNFKIIHVSLTHNSIQNANPETD